VLTPAGGIAPYAYNWSPVPPNGQGGSTATALCAGDYTVTVTDAAGCTSVQTYTIVEPQPLTLSGSSVPSACGACDGEASVIVAGGVPGYTYQWTLGAAIYGTDTAITDLCGGIYNVVVTDATGCTANLGFPYLISMVS